jgi:hypothetical protein
MSSDDASEVASQLSTLELNDAAAGTEDTCVLVAGAI